MSSSGAFPHRRQLPKLMACMTKTSLENLRNKALFSLDTLDAKGIRSVRPLYLSIATPSPDQGYSVQNFNHEVAKSTIFLPKDLIYDNIQLLSEDDIGIVVDLRKKEDYLEDISAGLMRAEKQRDKGNTKKECIELLTLALHYAEEGKGILWLAEKFFLASIAVSSQYLIDGGRQKACCKYHYARFLLDKFPDADPEEPFIILTEVRDSAIGKSWPLYEPENDNDEVPSDTVFSATAIQLHRVLLSKARFGRNKDPAKAERLSRLAERRAKDASDIRKTAEAIVEIGMSQLLMNNLNNAHKTFLRAFKIYEEDNNIEGLCDTRMHLAAVMQRLGDHETAGSLLTEMGALAMEHGLRRQLGRALHLLGELHLRRERPDLGTQHLTEAFQCFMGLNWQYKPSNNIAEKRSKDTSSALDVIFKTDEKEIYEEEAEQSRLMHAISAGQEIMASYFNLLREAGSCSVAKVKIIEWKLSRCKWWLKKPQHDYIPCPCPSHNRTPLDVLRIQMAEHALQKADALDEEEDAVLGRTGTVEDITKLRSSLNN